MHVIRTLQRSPHRDTELRIEDRDHPIVFYIELLLRSGEVFAFDDVIGFGPDAIDVAFFDQISFEYVVGAPNDFRAALAFCDCKNRRERIIFDQYRICRFAQGMAVCMRYQEDRLLRMIDEFARQARLVLTDKRDAILPGNVLRRDDYEFVPRDLRIERDARYFSAGNLTANGRAV